MLFPSFIYTLLIACLIAFRRNATNRHLAILVCMSGALYGFDLGSHYLTLNGHEVLVSETVVEMRRRGDWLIPMLNNMPRLFKPPLQYWLVGLSSGLTGRVDELSSRLPSAFFGAGLVIMTYLFGRRLFEERIAFLAGAVQAANYFMIRFSRQGTADIGNAFFVFAAFVCAWFILEGKNDKRLWQAGLWISFALDILVKGPFGVLTTLFTITIYALYFRRFKGLKDIFAVWAIILFLALSAPWFLYLGFKLEGTWHTWYEQTFLRVEGGILTKSPWYLYFPALAAFLGPWLLILPWAIARVFSKSESERRQILLYLLLWFAVEFLIILPSSTKRDRYLIWGLTPLAYLISIELIELGNKLKHNGKIANILGISGVIIGVVIGLTGFYLNMRFEWLPGNTRYFIPLISLVCVIFSVLLYKSRAKEAIVVFFATEVFFFQVGTRLLSPRFAADLPIVTFAEEISEKVAPANRIFSINAAKPAIVFYSRRYLYPVKSVEEALKYNKNNLPLYIVSNDCAEFSTQYPQFNLLAFSSGPDLEEEGKITKKRFGLFMVNTTK